MQDEYIIASAIEEDYMAKLLEKEVPEKLLLVCTSTMGEKFWFGNAGRGNLCQVICCVRFHDRSFEFCFGLINGDWHFKTLLLWDKNLNRLFAREGLCEAGYDFGDIWHDTVQVTIRGSTSNVVKRFNMDEVEDNRNHLDFCGVVPVEEKVSLYKERFPVPSGFLEQLKYTIRKAYYCYDIARKMGLLALEDDIGYDDGREDLFNYGMQFVVDGTDSSYIDKILSNIIEQEYDHKIRMLKTIQKEAVLSIQSGDNIRIMMMLLVSYVDDVSLKWLQKEFEGDENIRCYLR